jgi:CRP-like cAMP-binding protein
MPRDGRRDNDLLASLSSADFESLRAHLQPVDLKYESVLLEAGDPVSRIYFPISGIISLVVRLKGGFAVEAAMVGRDGAFGAGYAFSGQPCLCTAIVQMAGKALTIDAKSLRSAAAQSATLLTALLGYEHIVHAQALQSTACSALHTVESRLSRWLLRARDLSKSDRLTFSQEFLAQMLGTHRNTVSVVAQSLQQAGLIQYSRGRIDIIDVPNLIKSSCECYEVIKSIAANAGYATHK